MLGGGSRKGEGASGDDGGLRHSSDRPEAGSARQSDVAPTAFAAAGGPTRARLRPASLRPFRPALADRRGFRAAAPRRHRRLDVSVQRRCRSEPEPWLLGIVAAARSRGGSGLPREVILLDGVEPRAARPRRGLARALPTAVHGAVWSAPTMLDRPAYGTYEVRVDEILSDRRRERVTPRVATRRCGATRLSRPSRAGGRARPDRCRRATSPRAAVPLRAGAGPGLSRRLRHAVSRLFRRDRRAMGTQLRRRQIVSAPASNRRARSRHRRPSGAASRRRIDRGAAAALGRHRAGAHQWRSECGDRRGARMMATAGSRMSCRFRGCI